MSGSVPPTSTRGIPPAVFHVGAIMQMPPSDSHRFIKSQVVNVDSRHFHDPVFIALHVAGFLLGAYEANCLVWLTQSAVQMPDIQAAALQVERILETIEHLGRKVEGESRVDELECHLTLAVTDRHLGRAELPQAFDLRLMARNILAKEKSPNER